MAFRLGSLTVVLISSLLPLPPPKEGSYRLHVWLTVECPENRTWCARLQVWHLDHYTKQHPEIIHREYEYKKLLLLNRGNIKMLIKSSEYLLHVASVICAGISLALSVTSVLDLARETEETLPLPLPKTPPSVVALVSRNFLMRFIARLQSWLSR